MLCDFLSCCNCVGALPYNFLRVRSGYHSRGIKTKVEYDHNNRAIEGSINSQHNRKVLVVGSLLEQVCSEFIHQIAIGANR